MARMLQALKNLEARSPRTGSSRPAAKGAPADAPRSEPVITIPLETPPARPPATTDDAETEIPLSKVRPTRRADAPPPTSPGLPENSTIILAPPGKASEPVSPLPSTRPVEVEAPRAAAAPTMADVAGEWRVRPPCNFERLAQRTLSDPIRSKPLTQLAERLRRDAEQSSSTTLALVGVGPQSATHPMLFHAAALLAGTAARGIVLVEADIARRPLSEALEYGNQPGVSELLESDGASNSHELPTAIRRLSFLPAGRVRHLDLSTKGARLEQLVQRLALRYSLVLLDAGRTDDLSASVLARLVDATYFVVQLGTVSTSEAQVALRDFRAAGARVLGCIAT